MERYYLQCGSDGDGSRDKRIISLKGNEVIIGRKELLSPHISRHHAAFRWRGDGWTVTCMGQNNMVVDGNLLVRDVEYPLSLESQIKFTERDVHTFKLKVAHVKGGRQAASTSAECHKKLRHESGSISMMQSSVSSEYMKVEHQLRGSEALQMQLKEEKKRMHQSLQQQQMELEEKYQQEKAQLEEQFQSGALAQQAMLEEKEVLAQKLKEEISTLQTELEEERKVLEERLRLEEDRNRALQEKENELRQLAKEKASLEEKQEEERQRLQKQLQDTETHKEELRQQVEAKNSAIQAKEAEYQQAEEERQRLQDQLAQERLTREDEKCRMEEQLMLAKAHEERGLKEAMDALEAEKKNLMTELATDFSEAKNKVVNSVSNVLEDEFQCAICNELFISAVLLNCSHTFCKYCIDRWKKNKMDCPSCRLPISCESRSLVVDNFIEKIVPTLSEEMKKKRAEIVAERNAEMKAQAEAAAIVTAQGNRGRGRGRGRGRISRARGTQRGQAALVQSTSVVNTLPAASSNFVNNQVQYIPHVSNQGIVRIQVPANNIQTMLNSQRIVRIQLPVNNAQTLHNVRGMVRIRLPAINEQTRPGSSSNPVTGNFRSSAPPVSSMPGRRGHWANGCPDLW